MDLIFIFQNYFTPWLRARFGRSERGASLVEYALLVALIAVVCIVALRFIGTSTRDTLNETGSSLSE